MFFADHGIKCGFHKHLFSSGNSIDLPDSFFWLKLSCTERSMHNKKVIVF